ncbi:histidine kinase dimerization/phospho-acceptor domain-containing protein [Leptolyngbya boryana]|uniref:histidine kinase dimerization/phospho-acceptor domain-containing protein n=1 Tax=Leptolyngbya boryana TaxID=1184 RepID=UPI00039F072A|nr:histidine kinase dimerization/phospho-acceptor domain-containing protein [Leptolyngbya boryana]
MKPEPSTASFLQGGGEMGRRIRELDWSKAPLGEPEQWQQSLKTAVRIMLTSRQPMWIAWGTNLTYLYNDAYRAILGGKHPEMLGQPTSVVWREIWDEVEPRTASVMLRNEATYDESLLLIMERNGYPEETYYTFSYSPIPDDQGGTGGIICANTDNTQQVIGERQLALLRVLAAKTADARTFDEACTFSAQCLAANPYDLPFALIYLIDVEQQQVILSGTAGIERDHPLALEAVGFDQDSIWQLSEVVRSQTSAIITNLTAELPKGAWQHPPHQAIVMPIVASGDTGQAGILVAGLNPFRLLDDNYQGFLDLVTGQIAASIANAQAYEEERKRAETLAELDRAKTVFFNNISHEFRTPLTLMLSPTEEALSDPIHPLPPTQRERIEIVQRNGMRLLKLVNTLLDFSRMKPDECKPFMNQLIWQATQQI